jgi:hypothetical protein
MSFIGVVGVVAQQAQAGAPPNAVSIATAASNAGGNTDDACWVSAGAGCPGVAGDMHSIAQTGTSSSWSSVDSGSTSQFTHSAPADTVQDFEGCSTVDQIRIKGYIRALNATSFAWNCAVDSSSLSNSCSVSMGTNSTAQDCTGGTDANVCTMTFGGGRGGLTGPASGDELKLLVRATATNAFGSTIAAPKVRIVYDYVT